MAWVGYGALKSNFKPHNEKTDEDIVIAQHDQILDMLYGKEMRVMEIKGHVG